MEAVTREKRKQMLPLCLAKDVAGKPIVADLASLPRMVTLNDVGIDADKDGRLKLQAKAVTYRYLDEEELAQQRKAAQAAQAAKQGKK